MTAVVLFLLTITANKQGPMVRTATMAGEMIAGRLVQLDDATIGVEGPDGPVTRPMRDILAIDLNEPVLAAAPITVVSSAGSVFACRGFTSDGREARLELTTGEMLKLAQLDVVGVLFAELAGADREDWVETARRRRTVDRLIVVRDDTRIELEGVAGKVDGEALQFFLDGDQVPVKRKRLFAILYANASGPGKRSIELLDRDGNVWSAEMVHWSAGQFRLRTPTGLERLLDAAAVARISFAGDRIAFLSDLEPTVIQHTPFFDTPWPLRRDTDLDGRPIRLDGQVHAKGLALHSKTLVEYAIGGEYRRVEAHMGIPASAGPRGDALVRILGDGRVIGEWRVRAGEPAIELGIDVTNVDHLQILVDYAGGLDLGDQVLFANARLVK